jgi:hypothetical protein
MTKVTKNQTDAMTVLVKTCLNNIFTETLRNGHLARSFAKAGTVNVEDLIVAGWTRTEAEKTFNGLVKHGLVHEEMKGTFFSLTGDWDTIRRETHSPVE